MKLAKKTGNSVTFTKIILKFIKTRKRRVARSLKKNAKYQQSRIVWPQTGKEFSTQVHGLRAQAFSANHLEPKPKAYDLNPRVVAKNLTEVSLCNGGL